MPTATLLRPGDILGGFRIEDVIGIGGMAIVYRAVQVSLGRPVALKVLSSKLTSDEVFRERFRREGTHAAALEHPNIVPVYDSGEEEGLLYLAMRLVEGTNLAELVQTRGVTADQTIEILRPIASALDTAHAAGLIHRDVKPQNILITSQGHPYLADFGVAKGSNTYGLTATGGFVGSVNYASPEQIKGLTLTSASDVYALTAVLYQCLTGHVPYPRETDAGIMHAHLSEPPPTLPTITGADSDFHTVLARGMAKDPGARYGHAGDLINAAGLSVGRLPSRMRKAVPAFPAEIARPDPLKQDADSLVDAPGLVSGQSSSAPPVPARSHETEIVASEELAGIREASAFTSADRRRAPAPAPEPAAVRSSRRWPLIAGGSVATVAAVLAVVLLMSSSSTGRRSAAPRPSAPSASAVAAQRLRVAGALAQALRMRHALGTTPPAGLHASRLSARAEALAQIAGSDEGAVRALARMPTPSRYSFPIGTLVKSLKQEETTLRQLADAARREARPLYASLRRAFAAGESERVAAARGVADAGVALAPIPQIDVATLPERRSVHRSAFAVGAPRVGGGGPATAGPPSAVAAPVRPSPRIYAPVPTAPAPTAPAPKPHAPAKPQVVVSAPS